MVVARDWGGKEKWNCCSVAIEFQSGKMENSRVLLYNNVHKVNNTIIFA